MSEANEHIQCFHYITNTLDPGFHRGDDQNIIFSHFPLNEEANRGGYGLTKPERIYPDRGQGKTGAEKAF